MAQEFDDRRMELVGEPARVAERVGTVFNTGYFSASATGALVYRSGNGDRSQLTWVDRKGKTSGVVGEPGPYVFLAVSPDGTRAATVRGNVAVDSLQDIWLFDFGRGVSTRFTFGPGRSNNPAWSPDGKRIAFSADRERNSRLNLYQKLADGSQEEQLLLKTDQDKVLSSWSRDGRFLMYTVLDPSTKSDIWVMPLDGNRKPFPFLRTPNNEREGVFSPDGHWVAYSSDESGRNEVYVRAFSPDGADGSSAGGKWMISRDGGVRPWWRPDGKELLYNRSGQTAMSVEVNSSPVFQSGQPSVAFNALPGVSVAALSPDGNQILVAEPADNNKQSQFTVSLNWAPGIRR
jgi:Tol biopolymer transport system component